MTLNWFIFYVRLCQECQTLIDNHDQIKLLSNVRNDLNKTLKVRWPLCFWLHIFLFSFWALRRKQINLGSVKSFLDAICLLFICFLFWEWISTQTLVWDMQLWSFEICQNPILCVSQKKVGCSIVNFNFVKWVEFC